MTDNTITREAAIDRMRDGLPCETTCAGSDWLKTRWEHFDPPYSHAKFRIPPEPRREAREWWVTSNGLAVTYQQWPSDTHVREVLPDEVCLRKMSEDEVRTAALMCQAHAGPLPSVGEICVLFAKYLGALKEPS